MRRLSNRFGTDEEANSSDSILGDKWDIELKAADRLTEISPADCRSNVFQASRIVHLSLSACHLVESVSPINLACQNIAQMALDFVYNKVTHCLAFEMKSTWRRSVGTWSTRLQWPAAPTSRRMFRMFQVVCRWEHIHTHTHSNCRRRGLQNC